MERRFPSALLGAVALHAALVGLSALFVDGGIRQVPLASNTNEVEVSILHDGPPSATVTEGSPGEASSHQAAHEQPVAHPPRSLRSTAPSPLHSGAEVQTGAVAEVNQGAAADGSSDPAPGASGTTPRPHIDLGLDGSIVARALRDVGPRDVGPRAARRRPTLVFDGWSESVVSKVAHTAAPRDGSALLTIEWDAQGHLVSIRSSAESSNPDGWRKLAVTLRKHLALRPQPSSRGHRLVYLVKAEVVKEGARSKLPESSNVSAQTFRDEQLPPANVLMLGVKADTSPAGQRVVSVMLANSQVL